MGQTIGSNNFYCPYSITSDTSYVWVSNFFGSETGVGSVTRITKETKQVVNFHGLVDGNPTFSLPFSISSDGSNVWVLNEPGSNGYIIQLPIENPDQPVFLHGPSYEFYYTTCLASDGSNVWVYNNNNNGIGSVTRIPCDNTSSPIVYSRSNYDFINDDYSPGYTKNIFSDGSDVWVSNSVGGDGSGSITRIPVNDPNNPIVYSDVKYGFDYPGSICSDGSNVWVLNNNYTNTTLTRINIDNSNNYDVYSGTSYQFSNSVSLYSDGTNVWVTNGLFRPVSITQIPINNPLNPIIYNQPNYEFFSPVSIVSDKKDVWVANNYSEFGLGSVTQMSAITGEFIYNYNNDPYQVGSPWPHNGGVSNTNSGLSPFQGPSFLTSPRVYSDASDLAFLSTPIVDASGVMYVIRGGSNEQSYLYALNPDFSVKWVSQSLWFAHGTPALSKDGILYIGSNVNYNSYLVAYDTQRTLTNDTMNPLWFSVPIRGYPANGPPAIGPDGTIYYVGSAQNDPNYSFLYAFDPCSNPTGDVLYKWLAPLATNSTTYFANSSSPAFDSAGILYVGAGQYLYAFTSHDASDQPIQPLWKSIPIGDNIYTSPLVDVNNQIYIASDTSLCAFNNQGQPLWSQPYGTNVSPALTPDGYIVLAQYDGLLIVSPQNGNILDTYYNGIGFSTNPCVDACGNIYVGSPTDNSVYQFLWNGTDLSYVSSYPLPAGNLFVREVPYRPGYTFFYGFNNAGFSLGADGTLYVSPMDEYGVNTSFYAFHHPPPPPVITDVVPKNRHASIYFTQDSNGGSPITDYLISINGGPFRSSGGQTTSPLVIRGLQLNQKYSARIEAVNKYGTSNPSNSFEFNTTPPICFGKGTDILCVHPITKKPMYCKIEDLKPGDLVKTYKHGAKRIERIAKGNLKNNVDVWYECMYRMKKREGMTEDLWVTGGHSVLVDKLPSYIKKKEMGILGVSMRIEDKYMWLASECGLFEKIEDEKVYSYYHMSLEGENEYKKYGIWGNGVLTETASKMEIERNVLKPINKKKNVYKR
jgi:hypothetical protein